MGDEEDLERLKRNAERAGEEYKKDQNRSSFLNWKHALKLVKLKMQDMGLLPPEQRGL